MRAGRKTSRKQAPATGLSGEKTVRFPLPPLQVGVGATRQNAETSLERTAAAARGIVDDETRARTDQMERLKAARLAATGTKSSACGDENDVT